VPGDHVRGLELKDPAAGKAAGQDLDGGLGIDVLIIEEHERFGDEYEGACDEKLVRGLHDLARA
jgi:hypothetical protein